MSSLLYPNTLQGLKFDSERTPVFRTGVQSAVSFKESRLRYALFPVFEFALQYEFLRNPAAGTSELKTLAGLYGAMWGRWDTFLYSDPVYNTVVDEPFGTTNGVTTQYQLVATFQNAGGPGVAELIQNLNGAPIIKRNGSTLSTPTNYTIGPTGIVTLASAGAAGHPLTWSGSFYYRCRFDEDRLPVTEFMRRFFSTRQIRLRSVKL